MNKSVYLLQWDYHETGEWANGTLGVYSTRRLAEGAGSRWLAERGDNEDKYSYIVVETILNGDIDECWNDNDH